METKKVVSLFQSVASLPFLLASRRARLPVAAFQLWGREMIRLACCSKQLMARGLQYALGQEPVNLEAGAVLAENLYEEFGRGRTECCHIHLLGQFLKSLGAGNLESEPLPSTITCIGEHEALAREGFVSTLAGIWANEVCCPIEFAAIWEGVAALNPPPDVLHYLDVNLEADQEHCQDTWRILRPYVLQDARVVDRAVERSVTALSGFYDGLWREVVCMI